MGSTKVGRNSKGGDEIGGGQGSASPPPHVVTYGRRFLSARTCRPCCWAPWCPCHPCCRFPHCRPEPGWWSWALRCSPARYCFLTHSAPKCPNRSSSRPRGDPAASRTPRLWLRSSCCSRSSPFSAIGRSRDFPPDRVQDRCTSLQSPRNHKIATREGTAGMCKLYRHRECSSHCDGREFSARDAIYPAAAQRSVAASAPTAIPLDAA
jgi:hypothetical protein